MRKSFLAFAFLLHVHAVLAQVSADTISEAAVSRIVTLLASDSLKGRGNYSLQLHQAARFIEQEFNTAGLQPVLPRFVQPFSTKKLTAAEALPDSAGNYNPEKVLLNVVGMLPGKSKPDEIVVFSAHYDHIGTMPRKRKDNIYNGANDNASGTTALLALASHFARRDDNERTLLFCAFAGEELGLHGSRYFVRNFDTKGIKAVINIEMIGRAAIGKMAFFITGAAHSSFESIVQKALMGSGVELKAEPRTEKLLYQRSDNYSFVEKGIPAHSIMSSDDSDGCYHQACDEVTRLDIPNMTAIIRAVALATNTLISGADTPVLHLSADEN